MTRTDRRRFPILIAAIAALALAMTLLFSPVQAQEGSVPDKPTGLSATATHDQVVLTWDDPGDASITGYVILRRVRVNNTGGEFSELVADTGTAATTYTDATVKANTTYTYRIKATNEHGVSERSRWFHINVPAAPEPEEEQAPEPPDQPTGLDATATHDSVTLTWDDPNDDSITGYVILRRIPGVDPEGQFSELVADTGTAATTYTDDTVAAETRYTYRIKAINEHGVSERSRWSHINTPAAPVPGKPTGLTATATHDQVVLTWDGPGDDSITGYVILRRVRVNDVGGEFGVLVADTGSAATTYTDDTVVAGTTYTYRIKAINEHGESERSHWFHINVPAAPEPEEEQAPEPPDQPTGLDATATHDQVVLTWDDPGDDTITGYVILRRVRVNNTGGEFSELVADTGTAATTYTDDSVQANTTYTYRIKATNEHGVSERSRWSHINVPAAPEAVEGDDPDGEDGGAPGHATPPGPGKRANVSEGGTDLPANTTTTGQVEVGSSVTGNIGSFADRDYFRVVLEAGTRYQIDLEGAPTGRGTLADPALTLYDESEHNLLDDVNSGIGANSRGIFTPTTAGTYYLRVADFDETDTGTYTLSVIVLGANGASEADTDFPGTTATSGRVEVGGSVTGNRGSIGDTDWFAVVLEAGKTYQIDQKGEYSGVGTLEDPYLDNIRDSSGNQISSTFNNDVDFANGIFDSQIIFTPTAAGTYYLVAFANGLVTGTYTLSVRDITPPCTLNTGDIWCGVVTVAEVKTTADALVGHGFADGAGLSAGSLAGNPDDTMFSVGDNDYTIMAAYIQVPTGTTLTGTLYVLLSADLTEDDKAGLVLTVDDTTLTFAFSGATKGGTGLYSWGLSGLDWSATTTVTVRLSPPDDFPAGTTTTGKVDIGGSVTGNIESVGDADWFLVELEETTRYQIDLEGAPTGRGTVSDPTINAVRDAGGNTITGTQNDDSGVGNNARTIFTATADGTHYVVAASNGVTGTYTLSVIVLGANGASEADTDFSNTNVSTVDVGASVTGTIGFNGDTDLFNVALEAGKTYQFDLEGSHNGRGTLENPHLKLYRFVTVVGFNENISSTNKNSQIVYTPTTTGTYTLEPSTTETGGTGTYTLSVREIPPPCTLNIGDLWCGVVTVAEIKTNADVLVGHGFADGAGLSAGSLAGNPDDTMFSVGDNDYTISAAYIQVTTGSTPTGALYVLLSADLTDDDKAVLVLTVDDTTTMFEFSDATEGSTGLYSWGLSGLDWSSATTVTVRLSEPTTPDDFPADTTTTGQVDVGGSVTGNIDSIFDIDWFRVDLKKDKRYQTDLEGADTNRGTLTDPLLSRMRNVLGNVVTDALDSGIGNNARRIFTAPADGTHYVVASSNGVTGTYTLSVIVLGATGASEADTDFPADNTTTGRVDVGASATGNIESATDSDWFRVDLEAGKTYQFDLEGVDTGRGTVPDPVMTLYDSSDNLIRYNDDNDNFNSRIIYPATASGSYYLSAGDADEDSGTYTLSVTEAETRSTEGDTDFRGSIFTLGRVEVGGSATGNIESATDADFFRVDLEAGKAYQFELEGAGTGQGTLEDASVDLYDEIGDLAPVSGFPDQDNDLGNRFTYSVTTAGIYYVAASGINEGTGTYTLSVREVDDPPDDSDDPPADSTNVSEPDGEDLPEGITTTGRVEVGGSVTGEIAPALDVDWFAVELKKGKRYQFDVEGADTGRGNLADPHLWGLQDAGGQAVSGARSNDGGVGKNGRVIYTPDAEGTYYIAVSGAASTTGTYTLSVIVLGANGASEADTDFPRDTTTTGRVEVGASATGNIDPGEDLDGFRVNLEAGKRYRFDLEGADTGRGSQADPILALYGDSFNVSHYIDEDDDGGEGLNSRLTYTATATGIYHLEVAGLDPGTYTLSVREILLAVAVPPGGLGPSEIPGAVRNVSVSYSPVSGIGGQIVWWDAPDETGTGAQWITEFRIYGSASEGCGGYLLDAYEVEHPGSTTPPEHPDGTPTGFKYFKIVYVGHVKFGVAAVNELGEGPCEEGPDPPDNP